MAIVLRRDVAQRFASSVAVAAFGLQEQPTFRPAVSPDRFMPLADRIRDLEVGFAFPQINLDGLVPPVALPPARREADAAQELSVASLTMEARRMPMTTAVGGGAGGSHQLYG